MRINSTNALKHLYFGPNIGRSTHPLSPRRAFHPWAGRLVRWEEGRRYKRFLGQRQVFPSGGSRLASLRLASAQKFHPKLIHPLKRQYFIAFWKPFPRYRQPQRHCRRQCALLPRAYTYIVLLMSDVFVACNYLHYVWNFMEQFNPTTAMSGNQVKWSIGCPAKAITFCVRPIQAGN